MWTLLVTLALLGASLGFGAWRWGRATDRLLEQLRAAAEPLPTARVDLARELDGLPAPVQRYFRAVLTDGAPMVHDVVVEHRGSFNMGGEPQAPQWKPFDSRQVVLTRRPGFVWDARIRMLPGVAARVHDAYVAGEGRLHASVAGLVTLAELSGGGDLAQGELMRYLAEAAWYPTALLPSQGVRWAAIDEHSAMATLRDGAVEVSLRFVFGADGLVRTVATEGRGRSVGGRIVPTPWEGRWSGYAWRNGQRVPIEGEVAWLLPQGDLPYWRATIVTLRYGHAH